MTREEELSGVLPFWDKLKKNQKDLLCKHSRLSAVQKGSRLVSGSAESSCFYIKKGAFQVLLFGETETETELFRAKREDLCLLDYASVCGQEISDIAYQAVRPSEIVFVEKEAFSVLIKSCYPFVEYLTRYLLLSYPALVSAIRQRDYFSLEKRIVTLLLNESARLRSSVLSITHGQIASRIGSAREAVTRKLHEFSDVGSISLSRGKIIIVSKEKLKKRQSAVE